MDRTMSCPEMDPGALRKLRRGEEFIDGCCVLQAVSVARTGSRHEGTVVGSGQWHEDREHLSLVSARFDRVQAVGREA